MSLDKYIEEVKDRHSLCYCLDIKRLIRIVESFKDVLGSGIDLCGCGITKPICDRCTVSDMALSYNGEDPKTKKSEVDHGNR